MTNWSDIGQTLRTSRESRGSTIHDVAHYTRIPVRVLHELEEGDYSSFPSAAYAKGFLAQYSKHLDVDASEWLDEIKLDQEPLDLKNYEFLNDQEDELSPLPSHPPRSHARVEHDGGIKVPAAVLQPLAVFVATAMLLSAGVYGFIKLNERFSEVADDESAVKPAPTVVVTSRTPEGPARSSNASSTPVPVTPPLAVHTTPDSEGFTPVIHRDERAQQIVIDVKPPRAVIVEE